MSISGEQEYWNRNISNIHQNADKLEGAINRRDRELSLTTLNVMQGILNSLRHSLSENLPTKAEKERAQEKTKV